MWLAGASARRRVVGLRFLSTGGDSISFSFHRGEVITFWTKTNF